MPDLAHVLSELARRIAGADHGQPLPQRLCSAAADLLGCDGGAVTLAYTRDERVTLAVTDAVADAVDSAQEIVQQGPGADAYRTGQHHVSVVGQRGDRDPRWPLLDFDGVDGRPLVVHAVPMALRHETVGVLTLWESTPHSTVDIDTALLVADVIAVALAEQLHAEEGGVVESWATHDEVHQAAGVIVAQLGIPADAALALLRAQAYVRGQTVTQTARDIIERRLAFSAGPDEGIRTT